MQRRMSIVAAMLLLAAGLLVHAARAEQVAPRVLLDRLPMQVGRWTGTREPDLEPAVLEVLGVDAYIDRIYSASEDDSVGLYVGSYESQRRGKTMHSPLNCLPGSGWEPLTHDRARVDLNASSDGSGGSRAITINRYIVAQGLDRLVVLYWYQSHGRVVASEYAAKFYLVKDAIRMNRTDGALVRVISSIRDEEGPARAERRAVEFVRAVFPILGQYLPA